MRYASQLGCLVMLLLSYPAVAETVTENFADDPFWVSFNSTAASDNYGYSATNNAGGAIGEAGGVFGLHDAFDSYYADLDLGGTLYAGSSTPGQAELLTASGKISIDKSQSSNNNMSIAFFDQTNPTKGGDALRINIIDGNRFKLWLRLEIGKNLESPLVSGLVDGEYTWTMDWDPNGSADGLGEGTVTFNGISAGTPASISATLDIPMRNEGSNPEWLEEDIVFNAFGLHNFDGEANSANFIETFIDDVTYSVASAPSNSSTWGETGSGFWTDSRNWSPGEVPFGNDRTAVLGEGVTGDTTLLTSTVLTVKNIDFDNALFDYAVAGSSSTSLTLEADAGNATVNVIAGDHQFQIPVVLESDTDVDVDPGTSLSFNQLLDLNGNTLHVVDQPININNGLILGGGTLSTDLEASLNIGANASLDGTLLVSATEPVSAGDSYDILDFATLDQQFDTVVLPALAGNLQWDTSSLYADGTITAVPEPAGLIALITGVLAVLSGRFGNRGMPRFVAAGCVAGSVLLTASSTSAELIGQHFNFDPNWAGMNNVVPFGAPKARDDHNHYTYFADTANALGSPGEVGGYFGRNNFDAYYADTTLGGNLGGGFALQQPLHASGKFFINNDHNPNAAMYLGFFDASNPVNNGNRLNIMIAEIGGSPGFRPRLELRQTGGFDVNGNLETNLVEGHYNWTMDYDPNGNGGTGRVTATFVGPETVNLTLDLAAGSKSSGLTLNAFGFQNYNAFGQTPLLNKHYVFMDDLTYTTAEMADPNVQWAGPGSGSWNAAYSWQRTSTATGGGFVPDGTGRKAIFGTNITQDSLVTVDQDVMLKEIEFNNATHRYSIAGIGTVSLYAGIAVPAIVQVHQGQHEFLSTLQLDDDVLLTTDPGATLDLHGKLDLNSNSLTKNGAGTLSINNDLASTSGDLIVAGGRLEGVGTIGGNLTVQSDGVTVAPGNSAGALAISGNYVENQASTLAIELGGLSAGDQYDVLDVTGNAALANSTTIDVSLISGFSPVDGNFFDVLTATAVTADPSQLNLTGASDFSASVVDVAGGQALRLTFGDSADFDEDGDVDGQDFQTLQRGLGTVAGATRSDGDANLDGEVNALDLDVWQLQYGAVQILASVSAVSAVPEPSSSMMLILGCLATTYLHRFSDLFDRTI